MIRISAILLAATLSMLPFQAQAQTGNARTCALSTVMACTPEEGCEEWPVQEMALPRFVKIDLAAKTITSLDKEVSRNSSISSIEQLKNGVIILHGTELRGWSIALSEATGDLTLSAAGVNEGFVVFGSCIAP